MKQSIKQMKEIKQIKEKKAQMHWETLAGFVLVVIAIVVLIILAIKFGQGGNSIIKTMD